MNTARLILNGDEHELPVVVGTENEVGIDVTSLRSQTGAITIDPGFANTGSCKSAITFIDGENGILRYRGYPIEQIELQNHGNILYFRNVYIREITDGVWPD